MRHTMTRFTIDVLLAVLCVVQPFSAGAQTKLTGQTAMKFLSIGVGARAAGLGYSFITNTDDISTIFWNPAGIATLSGTRAFVDINQWISDIKQISFAASQDLGTYGVVGLNFTTMDYGDIPGTAIEFSAANTGSFEYVETGQRQGGQLCSWPLLRPCHFHRIRRGRSGEVRVFRPRYEHHCARRKPRDNRQYSVDPGV